MVFNSLNTLVYLLHGSCTHSDCDYETVTFVRDAQVRDLRLFTLLSRETLMLIEICDDRTPSL